MRLIIGLGNPGKLYEQSRHNVGFMCLNYFAKQHGIKFDKKEGKARTGHGIITGEHIVLARPQTYMNNSGDSVKALLNRFKLGLDDLLVLHDDLDLPPGTIRIRRNSGSGGHRGIDSIISCLGSRDFTRVRVGIGRPEEEEPADLFSEDEVIKYVLSGFPPEEKTIIDETIPRVSEAILCLLNEGITAAMNRYN